MPKTVSTNTPHWSWIILTAGFFTVLIAYGIRFGYGILLPEMIAKNSLNLTKAEAGMITSAFFATYIIFASIAGIAMDKFGGRKVITIFCVFLGSGTIMMGVATSLVTASIAYAIVGVGAAGCWVPVTTIVSKWFSNRRIGIALGILSTGYALGYGILGLILPSLVKNIGWRSCWYILGSLALCLVIINGLLLRDPSKNKISENLDGELKKGRWRENQKPLFRYKKILKSSIFWLIAISYFLVTVAANVMMVFAVTYVKDELGIAYTTAGIVASLVAFSGIPSGPAIGMLSDRVGRKNVLMLCNFIIAISVLMFVLVDHIIWALMLCSVFFGAAFAGERALYAACAPDYFSGNISGTVMGLWTIFFGAGAIFSSIFSGYIADLTNSFFWSFISCSIFAICGLLLLIPLRKPTDNLIDSFVSFEG
jgi:MFS family permease